MVRNIQYMFLLLSVSIQPTSTCILFSYNDDIKGLLISYILPVIFRDY